MYKYPTMTKTMSTVSESGTKETFILHVEVRHFTVMKSFLVTKYTTQKFCRHDV